MMAGIAELLLVALLAGLRVSGPGNAVLTGEPVAGVHQFGMTSLTELLVVAHLTVFGLLLGRSEVVFQPVVEMGIRLSVPMAALAELELVARLALRGVLSDLELMVYIPVFLVVRVRFLGPNGRFLRERRSRPEGHKVSYKRVKLLR